MSDVARQVPASSWPLDTPKRSTEVLVPLGKMGANDNEVIVEPQQPEARLFEMPAAVWRVMIACCAFFLLALLGATGGVRATFAIGICAVYFAMFFGTARALLRQSPPQPRSVLERRSGVLQTAFGPLGRGEAYAQVLIVPAAVAAFGSAISVIGAVAM
jgi:hypothetical protein